MLELLPMRQQTQQKVLYISAQEKLLIKVKSSSITLSSTEYVVE